MVIEVDGSSHIGKGTYDKDREAYLEGLKLIVIRVSAVAVLRSLGDIMDYLVNHPALKGTPPKEGNLDNGCD